MRDLSDRQLERLFELDNAPGPARPVDDARAAAIVAAALGGAGFPPAGGGGGGGVGGGANKVMAAGAAKRGVAIKLAVLAGGGAAVTLAAVVWLAMSPREPAPVAAPPLAAGAAVAPRVTPAPTTAPAAAAPAAVAPATTPTATVTRVPTEPPAEPIVTPGPAEPASAADGSSERAAPSRPPPVKIMKPAPAHRRHPPHAAPPAVALAPDDLLAEANAARAAHRWRDADTLYGRVANHGQADLAAQAALVASASLHLEHLGDPAGAARRFRAALAAGPRDSLAEDARWGLVEAARALADPAGELAALDDFLAHHAGSALAARARSRRAQLGGAP